MFWIVSAIQLASSFQIVSTLYKGEMTLVVYTQFYLVRNCHIRKTSELVGIFMKYLAELDF